MINALDLEREDLLLFLPFSFNLFPRRIFHGETAEEPFEHRKGGAAS